MPLHPGSSRKVISENIHEMVAAGHPVKQAVAAALNNAHYKRKHDPNQGSHEVGHPSHAAIHRKALHHAMKRIGHPDAKRVYDTDNDND